MNTRPVLSQGAIVAAVNAVLLMLVGLGVLKFDNDQVTLIVEATAAILMVAAPLVGGIWGDQRTVSTASLQSDDGKPVTPASVRGGQRVSVDPTKAHK